MTRATDTHPAARAAALWAVAVAITLLSAAWASSASATSLPDGRAYELVSPPDKNGGDVIADSQRTRAASDGGAVGFISLTAFGTVSGTGVATDYVAERSAEAAPQSAGWSTHAITPLQEGIAVRALGGAYEPRFEGEFSADLDRGVFFAWSPLTDAAGVANVANLYRGSGLRSLGSASFDLMTACPLCEATRTPFPPLPRNPQGVSKLRTVLAGVSPGLDHVIFESRYPLTSDTPAQPTECALFTRASDFCQAHVYESENGTVRLVGILPDGTPADVSIAGVGAGSTHLLTRLPHVVSNGADGHTRIFFTQPTDADGQSSSQLDLGGQYQVNQAYAGNLFVRIDGTRTEQLNVSERTGGNAFATAQWLDASADGTRAFFMTKAALTNDALVGTDVQIYMYDSSKPASAPDNLTLLNPGRGDAGGLIGASDDGHYVYMISGSEIVMWHDGELRSIGPRPPLGAVDDVLSTSTNYVLNPRQARVTPDGRHLLFSTTSGNGLAGYDHGTCQSSLGEGCRELYLYSADENKLECVSCRPRGLPATAIATAVMRTNQGGTQTTWHETRALTDDGRHVFFSTAEALVPEDTNGTSDAYQYDTDTASAHLLSSGRGTSDSWFMDASRDGRDAFFVTRERLVGWDVDSAYDLYDARVGGGFPEPARAPTPCLRDACQGPSVLPPTVASTGTPLFRGGGNLQERLRRRAVACRRGFVKKQVRGKRKCVKRHRTQRAKRSHVGQRRGS